MVSEVQLKFQNTQNTDESSRSPCANMNAFVAWKETVTYFMSDNGHTKSQVLVLPRSECTETALLL